MSDDDNNAIVPVFGGALVDMEDVDRFVAAMEDTVDEGARGGDVSYMSFSGKMGRYKIGKDGREIDDGELFVVAPTMFTTGWICWKGGSPIAKRMAKLGQPKIMEPDPEEGGPFTNQKDGWSRARGITIKSLQRLEQIEFTNNSKSGVAVISDLQRDVLDRVKAQQPCVPIMHIGMEEFTAQGNTNYKPVFDVVEWITPEDLSKMADPDFDPMSYVDEPEEPVKPKTAPSPRRRL